MQKACRFLSKAICRSKVEDDQELTPNLPTLPTEIIEDILLRLPVKSLVGFRCVCIDWRNLLSTDDRFIYKHLSRTKVENPGFLLVTKLPEVNISTLNASYEQQMKDITSSWMLCPSLRLIGSSNGLVCFSLQNYYGRPRCIYIWNPSTKDWKKLPSPRFCSKMGYLLGFGFHSNDYNLVRIARSRDLTQVELYSLLRNSWKTLPILPDHYFNNYYMTRPANLNGAIHWIARRKSASGDYDVVLGFDMALEIWRELLFSDDMNRVDVQKFDVQSFKGCINVLTLDERKIHIWVMKEYGLKESWTKLVTIPCSPTIFFPTEFLDNGDVLLSGVSEEKECPPLFFRYNIEQGLMSEFTIQGVKCPMDSQILPYVDSLVSVVMHKEGRKRSCWY